MPDLMFDPATLMTAGQVQACALDPRRSVWISANAGTGKTEVLTRRVLSLLLADPTLEPAHILALTFTNAGASEMAARIPERLTKLAAMDAESQAVALKTDLGFEAQLDTPARLRALAHMVREAPPFIATLHGLAQHMLGRFPLEAGVSAGFALLDETARASVLMDTQNDLLLHVNGPLADALGLLLDELGERGWRDLTSLMITRWRQLKDILQKGGVAGVLARVADGIGLQDGDWGRPVLPTATEVSTLKAIVEIDPTHAAGDILRADDTPREELWRAFLLTKDDTPRARIVTKKIAEAVPDAVPTLTDAAERLANCLVQRKLARQYDITQALLVWAHAVRAAYMQRKAESGSLDFDDLLDGLERLLGHTDQEWVWYALDRRFRHLVVDEAQDNNAQQTRIVAHLARNMMSGDVGDATPRTVLAVGDVKQCIFHFQGARPDLFLGLRDEMEVWSGGAFAEVNLTHNFRSNPVVLQAVDAVFNLPHLAQTTTGDALTDWPTHHAVAAQRPGRVDVWPLIPPVPKTDVAPWSLPQNRVAAQVSNEEHQCATKVAAFLKAHHAQGTVMPSTGKPLRWNDVLIVVQRNGTAGLFAGVLQQAGIPVQAKAGLESPVLADAVALLRWVFNPLDSLALVQILKAYRGWVDAQVLALVVDVRAHAEEGVPWHTYVSATDGEWLAGWFAMRDQAPVEMVFRLADMFGNMRELAPLFEEAAAADTLRALVARLEAKEQTGKPLIAENGEGDCVRIMTVHGSKGLQAPLVILPETMRAMEDIGKEKILWPVEDGTGVLLPAADAALSPLGQQLREGMQAQARVNGLRELYVAMTRAVDWLVVCGWGQQDSLQRKPESTWYGLLWDMVERGNWDDENGVRTRGATFTCAPREDVGDVRAAPAYVVEEVGRHVNLPVSVENAQSVAQRRGEQVHALLQGLYVPDAPPDVVAEAGRVQELLPWAFGPESRAEVVVGLPQGTVGRIDRLVRQQGVLWVLDFKTGAAQEPTPPVYAQQLMGYVHALRAGGETGKICAGVVWTEAGVLVEVPVVE